jgi:hypothetical protein
MTILPLLAASILLVAALKFAARHRAPQLLPVRRSHARR